MGKVTKKEMPIWAQLGHKKPTTRREFLGYGMIPFAARMLVPGALGLLGTGFASDANAEANCAAGAAGLIPFITLNLSGGGSLASNAVPMNASGAPIASYTKIGLGDNSGANALSFDSEFGVAAFAKLGTTAFHPMLDAIRTKASTMTLANTAMIKVCTQLQDDTTSNKFDASGLVYKAGLAGSILPNLGRLATPTGVGMQPATVTPPRPLAVTSFNDLVNSIGYTRALATTVLNAEQQGKLAKLVANLSNSQAQKLAAIQSTAGVKDLIECAGIKNASVVGSGATLVTPTAAIQTLWNIATLNNSQDSVFASSVYNALQGNAGTVGMTIGGYDYHTGNRTTGNTKDAEAGRVIGAILETAALLGKKVFLFVNSDGSTVSTESAAPGAAWVSDRGSAAMALLFLYDPAGRPVTNGSQIGAFTDGQVADPTTVVGSNPEVSAQAVFANYLKFNNRMDLFEKVIPRGTLQDQVLKSVLKVGAA